MNKNVRWKLLASLGAFILFFALGPYPILAQKYRLPIPRDWLAAKQLKLGLDLKGGVHMVLRVQTDDALRIHTQTTSEQLREALRTAGIAPSSIALTGADSFHVAGIPGPRDAEFRRIADDQSATNYNRNAGAGGTYDFVMKPNVANDMREQAVVQALQTIDRRVNELGVAEPNISRYGQSNDEILVQLPGVSDVARAKEIISNTAVLELKIVESGPAGSQEQLLQTYGGKAPEDMQIVQGSVTAGDASYYLVRKVPAVTGQDLRSAKPTIDENNQPAVAFSLTNDGSRKFGKVTGENVGRLLAIVLDNRVISAPRIEQRITTDGRIHGSFTTDQVNDLSLVLRTGALPASLTYLQETVIGPSLGADSIRAGVLASLVGLALIVMFMLVYYRLSGVNAVVALIFNLVILLGLMAYINATMTLPGIAGFVLTMGIGVDSNVLIFERIKEELDAQRGVRASINAGFSRVLWTLVDTHVASLISAAFLFQFGTGPIRGFAMTLVIGLISNLFTSVFVSKTLFEAALGHRQTAALSI